MAADNAKCNTISNTYASYTVPSTGVLRSSTLFFSETLSIRIEVWFERCLTRSSANAEGPRGVKF